MDEIRYIHAADLHLDTSFQGIEKSAIAGSQAAKMLHQATFAALENLVKLCLAEKPDFLVLAGDVYTMEDRSIRAQVALRDALKQLEKNGIQVFIAQGNHDPLASRIASLKLPGNTFVFGAEPESHIYMRDGAPVAVIHGISHMQNRESRNLACLFHRDPAYDCFQLGVLHCALELGKCLDRYAPCTMEDLKSAALDAWALGHAHEREILCRNPFIAYSGNTQGLHINETGLRGCYVVRAAKTDGGWSCEATFRPLCSIQWEKFNVDLEGVDDFEGVEQRLYDCIENARLDIDPAVQAIVARVRLTGRTALNRILRQEDKLKELADAVVGNGHATPAVWIKDFDLDTRDFINADEYLQRDDLVGECARFAQNLRANATALSDVADKAFEPLLGNAVFRKICTGFTPETMQKILGRAELICLENLEGN